MVLSDFSAYIIIKLSLYVITVIIVKIRPDRIDKRVLNKIVLTNATNNQINEENLNKNNKNQNNTKKSDEENRKIRSTSSPECLQ